MLRKPVLILSFSAGIIFPLFSQNPLSVSPRSGDLYDTDVLTKEFHTGRREALRRQMPDNSAAILFAAPERNRSNDVSYKYHQDPDFYYYTGYLRPDAAVIIFKENFAVNGIISNEFIFVKDRDPEQELWTGKIPSREDVANSSGIKSVFINIRFENLDLNFGRLSKTFVKFPADANESSKEKGSVGWMAAKLREKTKSFSDNTDTGKLAQMSASLREIKTTEEIALLQKAVDLTCTGFNEALKAAEPGMTEYQLQAINEFFWHYGGAEYPGYPSIVGGGENSCVLHYETNRKKLIPGDIVVMDMGAEYHGYTADVTRSFPVNGKFSPEQEIIYQLVLEAQKAGFDACKPGNNFNAPHFAAAKVIADGLKKSGIIKDDEEAENYFMHGTSHYLGLDVHDAGLYGALKPGNVITVEPGIYIKAGSDCDKKWWNIGIRIEDDVLITKDGYSILSDCTPRTIDEIEKIMGETGIFNQLKRVK